MKRRTFLASSVASLSVTAGCLGGGGGSGAKLSVTPTDGDTDGYPPAFDDKPTERSIDTSSFGTVKENGVEVPLAPIDVAHYWYKRGEARFADARGKKSYKESHIYGAVLSQASKKRRADADPVMDWPKDDRIVCYCGCPHHLSSIRASQLINAGYKNVYVIDEGFWKWHKKGYPMRGNNVTSKPKSWVISGETATSLAGENAWARHRPSGQVESTDISDAGSYELHLKFHEVGPDSTIEVETPSYTVEGKLKDLATGTVQG
ncbi:rhodanese-like domain-containing protein [Halorussus gelatinilyticus]|uniref:Rhodanese-like domain-containing protein n=1 Tax=Halorussus gelatinilyticus TaxID=2937524 RepID=A0A8U0IGE7_9EURY|nr:rhodanese-like domain-containing protein [Halorussus gelatinilyticus]UPV99745.1 rhodanese-like domain-containing protein [Halorussus gelatinilyticus]